MKYSHVVLLLTLILMLAPSSILLAQEPCEVEPFEVLNVDPCDLSKWIAVEDSATLCQIKCVFDNPEEPGDKCGIKPSWIGGTVEANEEAEHGFNFIPSTVRIAEITAEALQTTLCAMAENPKEYDGGLWYVHYDVQDIK